MRILQLIDTLHPGGAERMAINYANVLQEEDHVSFLVCTRQEGVFKELIHKKVQYLFLNKKNVLDFRAFLKLKVFIKNNKIEIIHAHGTSWFYAVLCKFAVKNIKLIWHDHYGNSEYLEKRSKFPLNIFSKCFNGIIAVNEKLRDWAQNNLKCKRVIQLNNFIFHYENDGLLEKKGKDIVNIVCLANLRPQKDHLFLLKVYDQLIEHSRLNLHIIGKDFKDSYSEMLKKEFDKRSYISYHGEISDPLPFLKKMNIGVLSSKSEGLPMAILEYGMAGLPVISTDVGQNRSVLDATGKVIRNGDLKSFVETLRLYINNPKIRKVDGAAFKVRVKQYYSHRSVITHYLGFCESL